MKHVHFPLPFQTKDTFDLNVAACRLMLDILPGLQNSVFLETDGLVPKLYVWAEKAKEPLQSYATGLLAVAMESSDVATDLENRFDVDGFRYGVFGKFAVTSSSEIVVLMWFIALFIGNLTINQTKSFWRLGEDPVFFLHQGIFLLWKISPL